MNVTHYTYGKYDRYENERKSLFAHTLGSTEHRYST